MGGPNIVLTGLASEFAQRASGFLAETPERNVAATVLAGILDGHHADSSPLFAYGEDETGGLRFAVLRTPPWPLLVSDLDPALAVGLIDRWLKSDPEMPGVSGLPDATAAVAAAWRTRTGGRTQRRMQMALHCLERVDDPPRLAPGALRPPTTGERELLIAWTGGFELETGQLGGDPAARVDERLSHGGWWLWEDRQPVSLVGLAQPVAGVVRLGPVYTPPEWRSRGYASAAVAAASRQALAAGARRCMLYTDLANPTSNRIYAEVGYRRIAKWEEHSFSPG